MIRYQSEVVIARPPEAVFPYIVEREKQALWSDVPSKALSDGPLGSGSRIVVSFGMGPLHASVELRFTAFEPNRRLAWTSAPGSISWDGEYRLGASEPGQTTVSQSGELTFRGLWRLLEPIVGTEIRSGEVKELERLKAVVEATPQH